MAHLGFLPFSLIYQVAFQPDQSVNRRSCEQLMSTNEAFQSMLATLSNIELLKSEKEECLRYFVAGKDVTAHNFR